MKVKNFLLTFYLGTIITIFIFLLVTDHLTSTALIIGFALLSILIYVASYFLSKFILKQVQKISIKNPPSLTKKHYWQIFAIFFFITFLVGFIWFLAYNPGGFSPDSINQYEQAISGNYIDWHPALHTFLFFTIPLAIFHNVAAITILQILLFSAAVAYAATTIYEIAGKKASLISFLLIVLNPWIFDQLMFPWKDIAFGIVALFISAISLKIYVKKGTWDKNIYRLIILAILLVLATIFRHNGIFFTLPAIVALFFFLDRKKYFILLGTSAVLFLLIKVPFYSVLNVAPATGRTSETAGLPMTMLSNVAKVNGVDCLNPDTREFLLSVAPLSKYQTEYVTGNFNSIKWTSNVAAIDDAGLFNIAKFTVDGLIKSPRASLAAIFKLTDVVYAIDGEAPNFATPHIMENPDIKPHYNKLLKSAIEVYRTVLENSIFKYFSFIGITVFIIIIAILGKNRWRAGGWHKILLLSPILFYDFGTMLLLTEPEARFFFLNLICYPLITVFALKTMPTTISAATKTKPAKKAKRTSKYVVIGIILTLFNFGVYTIIARFIINNNELLWLSNLIATFITAILAYILHSKITWKERNPGRSGVYKFFAWNLALAFAISPFLTWIFGLMTFIYDFAFNISSALHLPFDYNFIQSTGAFGFTALVTMFLNFFFYDKIVFGKAIESATPIQPKTIAAKSNAKVSIIVPIYNTAKFLPACLDSIIKQTHQNLEIILIDDGSTDNSGKIADDYAKKDTRIKVFHQKNSGQSAARNSGLKRASGTYISFIDADDKIKPNFIAELLVPFNDAGVTLSACGIHYKRLKQNSAEDVYITPLRSKKSHESQKSYILHLLAIDGRMYSSVNKLYLAKTAKTLKFDESLNFAEDTKFVLNYLKKSQGNISFVLKPLYVYNFGTEGSTINQTAISWQNWQTSYNFLKTWLGKNPTFQEKFWLHLVHLRWRISYIRSVKRAKQ